MPKGIPANAWWLVAAQFVVFAILLTLGMRTIANYVALAAACAIVIFAAVRRTGIGKGPPRSN